MGARSYPIFGIACGLAHALGSQGSKRAIYPAHLLYTKAPNSIEGELLVQMESVIKGFEVPEQGILVIQNGMATRSGGHLTSQGRLITTYLQTLDGKPPSQHDLFYFSSRKFFPRIYHADHPVVSLTAGWQGAFYHWMFEVLPRLHLIERAGYLGSAIYLEAAERFQKESLQLLEIDPDKIINAHAYAAVKAPRLIIPSVPQLPTEWSCSYLRNKLLPKLTKKPPLRLYISRGDATRRRILNEEDVYTLLETKGFQKVHLSKLSFKEQAEFFYAAEAVVAPHGAGLSHLLFCAPQTPVLEIFSPHYFQPCYWHVCDRIGLDYHYLVGKKMVMDSQDPDIVVDIDKLKASLKQMNV